MSESSVEHADVYQFEAVAPSSLSGAEMARCVAIIGDGGAVPEANARSGLRRASGLVVARRDGQIVAVGALKRPRGSYVAGVSEKAGHDISEDAQELGYVAVDPSHRDRHLSTRIVRSLLEHGSGGLFATTDDPKMKTVLGRAGFQNRGREWDGQRGKLSLWVMDSEADLND